jgi:hypothetical protein
MEKPLEKKLKIHMDENTPNEEHNLKENEDAFEQVCNEHKLPNMCSSHTSGDHIRKNEDGLKFDFL